MLQELSMVEQRYLAVREVLDTGASVTDVFTRMPRRRAGHAVVGDEDADPKVARITAIPADGNLELEVLPGAVESHLDLLARA